MTGTENRFCIALIKYVTGEMSADSRESLQFSFAGMNQNSGSGPEFKDLITVRSEFAHSCSTDFFSAGFYTFRGKNITDNRIEK